MDERGFRNFGQEAEAAPALFLEDVRAAGKRAELGRLGLLGLEAREYGWRADGLRVVGQELARLEGLGDSGGGCGRVLRGLAEGTGAEQISDLELGFGAEENDWGWDHSLVFTGHMIDAPGRRTPRFPAGVELAASDAIRRAVRGFVGEHGGRIVGLAGGASGGDILFHEVCAELGVETLLRLTLPEEAFAAASVAPAGGDWVGRFEALVARLGEERIAVLGESEELPSWMAGRRGYDVWQRTNLWLVQEAVAAAAGRTLIALWDGQPGDGPGGTGDLVAAAPRYGVAVGSVIRVDRLRY